jgi:hypothetical protein
MTSNPMTGGFSPYVLFRRGTLGADALTGLVPERTWALLDEAERCGERRAALAAELEQALHDAIPALPPESRRAVLALRRAVHNDRAPRPGPVAGLPPDCAALLAAWTRARADGDALLAEAETALAADLDAARKVLAEVAAGEDFQRGLQLSGEELHREVSAYAADPCDHRRKPSRRRRAESTVVSYAYRVVLKPSPFGSFTEIGAVPWATAAAPATGGAGQRVVTTRLNIGLVGWLAQQLRHLDGASGLFRVRLNTTLTVTGDKAVFVRRPSEGTGDAFQPDRVITARHSDLVRLLVDVLGDGDLSERELHERLTAAGLPAPAATRTIDSLVQVGLCHRDLGLPDQTLRPAAVVAERLRTLPGAGAARCAEVFERLQQIEDGFAAADVTARAALLADLRAQVDRLAALCGGPPAQDDAMRAAIYEDVGTHAPPASWQPGTMEANRGALELFQRLLPLLDEATVEKSGLYRLFTGRFGETAPPVPLLDFYAVFADLSPTEASALMSGAGDPAADRLRRHRSRFYDLLESGELGPADGSTTVLDPDRLRRFVAGLPADLPPWRSTAYRVQFGAEGGRTLAVVNGVTTGHGVFFSRFCDLLHRPGADRPGSDRPGADRPGGDRWDLGAAVGEHIRRSSPRQTDITAALGLNFNLHPRLTPYELVYPGSVARPGATGVLSLADVAVRADPARRRLLLVSGHDGAPLDLVPLNFLYPAAAPLLYRFLCGFAPTRTYRGGLWEQIDRARPASAPAHRPRVRLGDLVLDRRSWRVPIADLPGLDGLERQDVAALAGFDRWRRARGLPRTGFFRILVPPPDGGRDLIDETRRWALEARTARLHKPHFLDTRNPFLLSVLARQARACPGGTLLVQECLPAVEDHGAGRGAEEFFVEHDLTGGDHVGG